MNESKLRSSVTLRMFVMAMVALSLFVLAAVIRSLISERQHRRDEAINEVSQKWGNIQTITGPVLTLPFRKPTKDEKGKTVFYSDCLNVMPETLQAEVELNPEIRYRGIYEAVLYQAVIKLKGTFILPKLEKYDLSPEHLTLKEAFVTLGITDLRGIKNVITLNWGDEKLSVSPGVKLLNIVKSGFTVFPTVNLSRTEYAFSADLLLNGSREFNIIPVGKETLVTMSSTWNSPSFIGNFLPEKREISSNSFRAMWSVQQLNRNFPQAWTGSAYSVDHSAFGVKLLQPVDEYQKVTRSVKYAIMFIVLTFMAFFLTEIFSRATIHPVQYTLIGLAIILFYVILLSLSEHIPFNVSYTLASLGVILLVAAYAKSVLKTRRGAAVIGGILSALYLFLFVTLQLEDYALLLGSIGLFVILAAVMFLTRRIDWFEIGGIGNNQKTRSFKRENDFVEAQGVTD